MVEVGGALVVPSYVIKRRRSLIVNTLIPQHKQHKHYQSSKRNLVPLNYYFF